MKMDLSRFSEETQSNGFSLQSYGLLEGLQIHLCR